MGVYVNLLNFIRIYNSDYQKLTGLVQSLAKKINKMESQVSGDVHLVNFVEKKKQRTDMTPN